VTQYLITTQATPHRCPRCNAWTLTGHAEGVLAHVDPIPLDAHGELAALMDGRTTYNLHAELTGRQYLAQRTAIEIAAPRRCVVLTAHRCGRQIGVMPTPPAPPPALPDDGTVPF
jgi:hypothetical protein